jgi:hypothetical protein
MPSIIIERDETLLLTIPETLKISANKNCIIIQNSKGSTTFPVSDIKEIVIEVNRQLKSDLKGAAYDNSTIYIYRISQKYAVPGIFTGPYTEDVYEFLMKHVYGLGDDEKSHVLRHKTVNKDGKLV